MPPAANTSWAKSKLRPRRIRCSCRMTGQFAYSSETGKLQVIFRYFFGKYFRFCPMYALDLAAFSWYLIRVVPQGWRRRLVNNLLISCRWNVSACCKLPIPYGLSMSYDFDPPPGSKKTRWKAILSLKRVFFQLKSVGFRRQYAEQHALRQSSMYTLEVNWALLLVTLTVFPCSSAEKCG